MKLGNDQRDQLLAQLDESLTGLVESLRELRADRTERFGVIDRWRLLRDAAEMLNSNMPKAGPLLLAAALDRLVLQDTNPFAEIAGLDFEPEEASDGNTND